MNFRSWLIVLILISILGCRENSKMLQKHELTKNWKFRQEGESEWFEATVPGVVHTDLLSHDLIPHPWIGTNENKVQWIENENWEYESQFTSSTELLKHENIDLVFDGLDTYASVFLNDSLILEANNMFRSWRVPVKELLKKGNNKLEVKFHSPISYNLPALRRLDYELPAGSETVANKVSPFTRKAPYHFGWDWGPRLVTSGIWRPVYLESWNSARIENIRIIQKKLSNSLAQLEAIVTVNSRESQRLDIDVEEKQTSKEVQEGITEIKIPFEIENPKRWWPNGWGDQALYHIPVSLIINGVLLDSTSVNIGLRIVELVQERDSIGESFYFKVNGEPLFARGANYIPQSHFLPSISSDDYKRLIEDVKDANMNMIRVWGGGIYENDLFYDLCDQNGILVWQDLMFAGSMYPGDSSFIQNVKEEVIDNVVRLRNHPSIIHWNGNNEIEVAWKNWGWQKQYGYSSEDSAKIWNDYLSLFHNKIPRLLSELDDRPYTPTSPLSNWGTPENFNYSSMHYWGVWHGKDDFEGYYENVGRFMSEYGFQSFPDMETIKFFADSSSWSLDSEVMEHHQKSYVGNGLIKEQIEKYFSEAENFQDFIEKSQQAQAIAMQMAIDAHRLNKGHCWGSLFWQLNDCWPGPSWSSIDVFGRRKIFYEHLKTLFAPVALIPFKDGDKLTISLVNDELQDFQGTMKLIFWDSKNEVRKVEMPVYCAGYNLGKVYEIELDQIPNFKKISSIEMKLFKNEKLLFSRLMNFDLFLSM